MMGRKFLIINFNKKDIFNENDKERLIGDVKIVLGYRSPIYRLLIVLHRMTMIIIIIIIMTKLSYMINDLLSKIICDNC